MESEIPTRNSYRWRSRPLSGDLPPTTGGGGGDPHIHTLDGQHYTLLNQGNLNLTKRLFSTKTCVCFFFSSAVWKKRLLKVVWHGNLLNCLTSFVASLWRISSGRGFLDRGFPQPWSAHLADQSSKNLSLFAHFILWVPRTVASASASMSLNTLHNVLLYRRTFEWFALLSHN